MVPTEEARYLSQQGTAYCCIYHGQLLLPGFLLLQEPSSYVTGAINFNKKNLTIMSSLIQVDDNQSSDVLLSIWECDKVYRRGAFGYKDCWSCRFCGNEYNICNSTKPLLHLTRSGGHSIVQWRGEIIPNNWFQLKALKEKK